MSRREKGVQAAKSQDEMEVGCREKPIARSITQIGPCREQREQKQHATLRRDNSLAARFDDILVGVHLIGIGVTLTCTAVPALTWHVWHL